MFAQTIFLVEVLSAAFILWLGLYIITRDLPWRRTGSRRWLRPALLSGNALILLAVYLYGIAMESVARSPSDFLLWQQSTWWGVPIAVLLFVWSVMILTRTGEKKSWTRVLYPTTLYVGDRLFSCAIILGWSVPGYRYGGGEVHSHPESANSTRRLAPTPGCLSEDGQYPKLNPR